MGQLYRSKKFQKFDYESLNQRYYSKDTPPEVALEQISVPVALYLGAYDQIADIKDNENVKRRISNVVDYRVFADEDHLSLTFSKNMTYFAEVLSMMGQYTLN